ncbi:pyrroline-5-carboxylate reductase [Granulosicoccaceae sp. 1_MG-2023]|nr:pyrroline-5-carboxylate reductase [Granulosicoccaceae sp. 1_MG-2023]
MKDSKLVFIGAGNMARSLISGLINNGRSPASITATDINQSQLDKLQDTLAISTSVDNAAAIRQADIVVLAIKPQHIRALIDDTREALQERKPMIISIAAGLRESDLTRWIGAELPVVRCMPNTPSMLGAGVTALYANAKVSGEQRAMAGGILATAGITEWVAEEGLLDTVTAISGSGPAYFFLFSECIAAKAAELGLDKDTAVRFAAHTCFGAARMLIESGDSPEQLRLNVCSKGGTTEAAIASFEASGIRAMVNDAMDACYNRSIEMGKELGEEK